MDKILVVRLSSLGDVLLTVPVIRALARRYPHARIDFLTKPRFAPLIERHPALHQVRLIEKGDLRELSVLRSSIRSEYDWVVDLHNNLRSRILTSCLNGPLVTRYQKYSFRRMLLVRFGLNFMKAVPSVPERYLASVGKEGVEEDGQGLEFFSDSHAAEEAAGLVRQYGLQDKEVIALAPGARWLTKQWPVHRFVELVRLLPEKRFLVLGDASETKAAMALESAGDRVVNLAGKTNLSVAGELLRRSKVLVSGDTGLMHLACAVQIPVVALFGSTCREFGFFPFRAKSLVLEKELSCRPCTAIGKNACKKGTLQCLESITAPEVVDALSRIG